MPDIQTASTIPPNTLPPARRMALFDYGFRPFFLLAGIYGLLLVPVWLYIFTHHAVAFAGIAPMYWHAHEMLYGFVAAAIAGFLLTSVPSWTGARGFAGAPLIVLVLLWCLGRVAMASVDALPFAVVAVAELAFLPALAGLLMPPLLRSRNRNSRLLAVLAVLWLADAAFLFALKQADGVLAARAMTLAVDFVLILVTVIGGRIVPSFTANALRRQGVSADIRNEPWLERSVITLMIAIAIVDLCWPDTVGSGVLAAIAATAQAVRLAGWRSFNVRGESILWILHVGYAWLPVGLALKACWLLMGASWALKWQHALAMGVFGTMILAVMTRAALGHTGRPLTVSRAITIAYVLLTAAVTVRIFAGAWWPQHYLVTLLIAGALWMICFAIYIFVYAPILIRPRIDGKPG